METAAIMEADAPLDTPPRVPVANKTAKATKTPRPAPRLCGSEDVSGYIPLGYDGTANVIWSCARREVLYIEPGNLSPVMLETVLGMQFVLENYLEDSAGKDGGEGSRKVNWAALRSDIIAACQRAGRYDTASTFGAGVWYVTDNGKRRLIVNAGMSLWSPDGKPVKRVGPAGIFAESPAGGIPTAKTVPASDAETAELFHTIRTAWHWRNASDGLLVLGWLATSSLCGILRRRPGCCIVGPRGTGKSTLLDAIRNIAGRSAYQFEGSGTSAAGIRQKLRHDARAVILDEFGDNVTDSSTAAQRVKAIIVQIRSAYSDDSEGAVQGTQDGRGVTYRVRYSALLASIMPPVGMDAADRTRVVICPLSALPRSADLPDVFWDEEALRQRGEAIRARMIRFVPEFEQNLKLVINHLRVTGSARYAETLGPFIAGWYTCLHARAATTEEIGLMVDGLNLKPHLDAIESASDERACADWLLGHSENSSDKSVAELIQEARLGNKAADLALGSLGLAVKGTDLHIVRSKGHKRLRELYSQSKFAGGGWAVVLERVDGARVSKSWIRGEGKGVSEWIVAVPLRWLLDEPTQCELLDTTE